MFYKINNTDVVYNSGTAVFADGSMMLPTSSQTHMSKQNQIVRKKMISHSTVAVSECVHRDKLSCTCANHWNAVIVSIIRTRNSVACSISVIQPVKLWCGLYFRVGWRDRMDRHVEYVSCGAWNRNTFLQSCAHYPGIFVLVAVS